jgi:membrane-bound lytic murein transglycosylase D
LKKKRLQLILVGFILLFSGYIFYKNITYGVSFVADTELLHQRRIYKMPKKLFFADEVVQFKTSIAYKNYYREVKLRTKNSAATRQAIRNAGYWFPVIEGILKEYKLPDDLKYLALAESNLTNSKSKKGAAGFWQFTPKSGKHLGLVINEEIDERLDPIRSTHAACRYLKRLYNYFGSWSSAVAGYNLGESALYFAMRKQNVNSYYDLKLNKETASYLYRMVALKDLFENTKKYKVKYRRYKVVATKVVVVRQDILSVEEFAKKHGTTYKLVKALNPWMLKDKVHIPETKDALYVRIPKKV